MARKAHPPEINVQTSIVTEWEVNPSSWEHATSVEEANLVPTVNDTVTDISPVTNAKESSWNPMKKVIEGFTRHPGQALSLESGEQDSGRAREGSGKLQRLPMARELKGRHLQMIAIGGSIGSGLFVGSGSALALGGQGSLVLAYTTIGIFLYCTMQALGELSAVYPVPGAFVTYCTRFVDPAWGFAIGYNYALNWLVALPLELVSASLVLEYWGIATIQPFIALFLGLICFINLFGVRGYGEAEFLLSGVKVLATLGFIILGVIINIGGGPYTSGPYAGYVGVQFWHVAPFKNGFKGFCSTFVFAALAFAGTEIVGLAAAETKNPRKSIPTAIKQVFWRIIFFYLVSLTVVGFLVSADDPRLISATSSVDARASPFVIAIANSGIEVLPSVMNSVILISVLSVANSATFGSTRTLVSLAEKGQLPKAVGYIDREGRPLVAVAIAILFGCLGFIGSSARSETAFQWLAAISTLSSLITWGSICLCHIRFRKAWQASERSVQELPFVSQSGVVGSWIGVAATLLIIGTQLWLGIWPLDYHELSWPRRIQSLFSQGYLTVGVFVVCYFGYKLLYRTKICRTNSIDVATGARTISIDTFLEEEKTRQLNWPRWRRVYYYFC